MCAWPGWESFDPGSHEPKRSEGAVAKKPSKYHNARTKVDGLVFDSKREADRWMALRARAEAKDITNLRRQVSFDLTTLNRVAPEEGGFQTVGRYIADFTYLENGRVVVEDAKGVRTALYKWKKKHFEIEYGLSIREV